MTDSVRQSARQPVRHSIHSSTQTPKLHSDIRMNRSRRYAKQGSLLLSLSIFSYFGDALRVFSEKLFGTACHEPETVGWNAAQWAPCVTAPGNTEATGGAMFADVPANMIGCFIIGFMVSGDESLGLARDLPVAFLPENHFFQKWTMTHFSIRTGFCGALTTFASWNTQMVIMICAGKGTVLETQWVSALFGYVIGWMVAFQSFVMGRDVAIALHRRNNPQLAKEADILYHHRGIGMLVNRNLPDFERRYLYDIVLQENDYIVDDLLILESRHEKQNGNDDMEMDDTDPISEEYDDTEHMEMVPIPQVNGDKEQKQSDELEKDSDLISLDNGDTDQNGEENECTSPTKKMDNDPLTQCHANLFPEDHPHRDHFHHLKRWKDTTHNHRRHRVRPNSYITELHEIERTVLNSAEIPREDLLKIAEEESWPVDALEKWRESKRNSQDTSEKVLRNFLLYLALLVVMTVLLILCVIQWSDPDPISVTYRTAALSLLMSPFGTFTRWQLSKLNGRVRRENWQWFPLGTFTANMSASVISALLSGVILRLDSHWARSLVEAAIKGYAGSLSTVSIFVAEAVGLMQELPRHAWAYYYSIISLVTACVLGVCSYVWAVV